MKSKVAHLSSVHPHDDPRIFVKECRSLAKAGYEVYFVVPITEKGLTEKDGVKYISLKKHKSRLKRMLLTPWSLLNKALKLKADVYHLHDPELLPLGILLKLLGKKVIFDSHENVRQQILNKYYLPRWIRRFVAGFYGFIEDIAVNYFDGLITVVPSIAAMFNPEKTSIVANYPLVEEIEKMSDFDKGERRPEILFSGALTEKRGATMLMKALNLLEKREEIRLQLAGTIKPESLYQEIQAEQGWQKVEFHGWVNREKILELLKGV
jgi:glycosyltransferase involved in cell wall biosynthesis